MTAASIAPPDLPDRRRSASRTRCAWSRTIAVAGSVFAAALASAGQGGPDAIAATTATTAMNAATARTALNADAAVRASEAAVGRRIGEHTLLDRDGRAVRLASYRGKPLLVSFVYTGCFQACPAGTRALHQAVRALETRFGTGQYNVVSIGFNQPADSPAAMKAFAVQNGIDLPHWSFLSAPARDVEALTGDFGFSFTATAAGFDHVLQVTLVDAEGRIVRQVYGGEIAADALGEPLTLLLANRPLPLQSGLAQLVDRVRILCTVYDPATGTYRVDYSLALEVAGGMTFAIATFLYLLNDRRARRAARRSSQA
jgi:protein SCO1/2